MKSDYTEQWREKSFAELFDIRIGGTPSRSKPQYWAAQGQEGAPWASIADLRQPVVYDTKERITPEGIVHSNVKLLPAGTVLMSFKLTLGRIAVAGTPLYTNEAIAGFTPKNNEVLLDYFLQALPYIELGAELDMAVKGQTLNKDKLGRLVLIYPDVHSQRSIASVLGSFDKSVGASKKLIDQLEEFRRRAMQDLLTYGSGERSRPPGWTQEQALPVGWEPRELGTLGRIQAGRQRSPHHIAGTPRPYLRVANVFDGYIDTSDVLTMPFTDREFREYRLEVGDILLNEGQSLELVGRPAMYEGKPQDTCFQNTLVRFRAGREILPTFALQMFRHFLYSGQFAAIAKKTTSIAHLGVSRFAALKVALPPLEEQQEIVDILTAFDERIRIERERGRQLEVVKQGLAQQLLTGKLTVPAEREAVTG